MNKTPLPKNPENADQEQFLTILSREDALARFEAALFPRATSRESRPLAEALGRALAEDVTAPIDVPPFDRSNVDGFAVRSADLASAGEASPVRMMLNDEVIACGVAPVRPVLSGTATSIATGGPVPRGADAIVRHHRLARDRHAGRLRHRAGRRRAPAARRDPLHWRRTGAARPTPKTGRDLRHQRRDRHGRDHRERRRS